MSDINEGECVPTVVCFSKLEIYQHTRRNRNNQNDIVRVSHSKFFMFQKTDNLFFYP